MNYDIDELDDDLLEDGEQSSQSHVNQDPPSQEEDIVTEYLKTLGISNPDKIKFENDEGNIEERSWSSLSKDEKLNILRTSNEHPTVENNNNVDEYLSDEEILFLEELRKNKLTPSQYIEQLQIPNLQEPIYKIDDLSDDELYLLDLESRVGELTDDEAANALSVAKQNEDFYKKQVEGIRKEYKEREDYQIQQKEAEIEELQRLAFEQYQSNIVNAIDNFTSIGNLDLNLEDNDKDELAEFMLSQDEKTGVNYLYQALQDPQTLVKAAWFILNGDEALNNISDYFTSLIKLVSENQYKKGFEDGKKGKSSKPQIMIDTSKKSSSRQDFKTDADLYDDEE